MNNSFKKVQELEESNERHSEEKLEDFNLKSPFNIDELNKEKLKKTGVYEEEKDGESAKNTDKYSSTRGNTKAESNINTPITGKSGESVKSFENSEKKDLYEYDEIISVCMYTLLRINWTVVCESEWADGKEKITTNKKKDEMKAKRTNNEEKKKNKLPEKDIKKKNVFSQDQKYRKDKIIASILYQAHQKNFLSIRKISLG